MGWLNASHPIIQSIFLYISTKILPFTFRNKPEKQKNNKKKTCCSHHVLRYVFKVTNTLTFAFLNPSIPRERHRASGGGGVVAAEFDAGLHGRLLELSQRQTTTNAGHRTATPRGQNDTYGDSSKVSPPKERGLS